MERKMVPRLRLLRWFSPAALLLALVALGVLGYLLVGGGAFWLLFLSPVGILGALAAWLMLAWVEGAVTTALASREALEEEGRLLSRLNAVAGAANELVDVDQTLHRSLDKVLEVTGVEAGSIFVAEGHPQRLVLRAHRGLPEGLVAAASWGGVDRGVVGRVARSGEAALVSLAGEAGAGLHFAHLPLTAGGRVRGVLALASCPEAAFGVANLEQLLPLGGLIGAALVRAQGYDAAREQALELRQLEQLKTDLLLAASGGLGKPFTSLRATLDLLGKEDAGGGGWDQLLAHAKRSAETLGQAVSNLQEVAGIQSSNRHPSRERVDVNSLVGEAAAAVAPLLWAKEQPLKVEVPAILPSLEADRRHCVQILLNLLSNAHRFSPRGAQIDLAVRQEGQEVLFRVRDRGPGIPAQEQARLFERGGGLAVARSLVELHGGRIWVESEVGLGSTFCFALPTSRTRDRGKS